MIPLEIFHSIQSIKTLAFAILYRMKDAYINPLGIFHSVQDDKTSAFAILYRVKDLL
jgi:hypothetical protein